MADAPKFIISTTERRKIYVLLIVNVMDFRYVWKNKIINCSEKGWLTFEFLVTPSRSFITMYGFLFFEYYKDLPKTTTYKNEKQNLLQNPELSN